MIHYTRTAPLATLAADYKQHEESKKSTSNVLALKRSTAKLDSAIKSITDEYETKFRELQELIKEVEYMAQPREYVTNRVTQKVHKILTRVEDVGNAAMTCCAFKYARGAVSTHEELPHDLKRKHMCTTCLADLRAKTAKDVE